MHYKPFWVNEGDKNYIPTLYDNALDKYNKNILKQHLQLTHPDE